jgi:hypothetical protein
MLNDEPTVILARTVAERFFRKFPAEAMAMADDQEGFAAYMERTALAAIPDDCPEEARLHAGALVYRALLEIIRKHFSE